MDPIDEAFARLDRALDRAERAVAALPPPPDPAPLAELAAKHDRLRARVAESLQTIDSLLEEISA